MAKLSHALAVRAFQALQPFDGPNVFATLESGRYYVVWSYGRHFPMYCFDTQTSTWYGNKDGYSKTTACHKSKYHPWKTQPDNWKQVQESVVWLDTDALRSICVYGTDPQTVLERAS
jgi:hypothetical protein